MTAHYWEGPGSNRVGFVLSTPGKDEENAQRPAAGSTGENMDAILYHLNKWNPMIFPSTDRYGYLITNASTKVMYAGIDDGKTEDQKYNIITSANIKRLNKQLAKCDVIILCGDKAHLIEPYLVDKIALKVPHLGGKGLHNKYNNKHPALVGINNGMQREIVRYKLCADDIINQLEDALKLNKL